MLVELPGTGPETNREKAAVRALSRPPKPDPLGAGPGGLAVGALLVLALIGAQILHVGSGCCDEPGIEASPGDGSGQTAPAAWSDDEDQAAGPSPEHRVEAAPARAEGARFAMVASLAEE